MDKEKYEINCAAMAIVNFTNETNAVDVTARQANNDKCFDFAVLKIEQFQNSETERWKALYDSMVRTWQSTEAEVEMLKREQKTKRVEDPLRYY